MTVERALRGIAGAMVLLSLALGYYVSPYWFILTAFVGVNLLQSAFTNWCPAMVLLRRMGLKDEAQGQNIIGMSISVKAGRR